MEGSSDDNKIELQPKVRIYTLKYNASKDCQIACLNLFRRKAKMKWLEITNNRPDRLTENANVSIGFFCKVGTGETTRGERNSEQELTEVTRRLMYIWSCQISKVPSPVPVPITAPLPMPLVSNFFRRAQLRRAGCSCICG